jgi:MOSC domain-containing protein YiiM
MPAVLTVNLGSTRPSAHARLGRTGIDKRPVDHPVLVAAPGPKGIGGSGLAGDSVCDLRHHGGDDQAIYAYAREDLDVWAAELGRPLDNGSFGENLTTAGIDLTGALVGETWSVGAEVVLQISDPRIPCRTFAGWLGEQGWMRRFTQRAACGTYLRVVRGGHLRSGDEVTVLARPDHDVTVSTAFRALTTEPDLLPRLVAVEGLSAEARNTASRRSGQPE